MTGSEFKTEMTRLVNRYLKSHPNAYPEEVQKIFWDYVKSISGKEWARIVNQVMARNTFPPMLDKIEGHVNPILDKLYKAEKEKHRIEAEKTMNEYKANPDLGRQISEFVKKLGG